MTPYYYLIRDTGCRIKPYSFDVSHLLVIVLSTIVVGGMCCSEAISQIVLEEERGGQLMSCCPEACSFFAVTRKLFESLRY